MKEGMLKVGCFALALLCAIGAAADPAAVVTCGKARFTVLTDRLVRMEYAEDGRFEDRASLAFVNRRLPVPAFKAIPTADGRGVTLDTGKVRLAYAGGDFSPETLSAAFSFADGRGLDPDWRFGDADTGNLYGTRRTLDLIADRRMLLEYEGGMEPGILSRGGWTAVDDSARHLFEPTADVWGANIVARPAGARRDLYLFAYGHDYVGALADFTRVAGKIPLPPRWAFGYWWSRFWQYSDTELEDLMRRFKDGGYPIDVLIIDMDWHETRGWGLTYEKDEFGETDGWTGYTWNRNYFQNPSNFFAFCRREGLRTALNLHPASGVVPAEACYGAFCADYGWTATNAVPYKFDEAKWRDSYFKTVLGPIETEGVDFWWLDWQQWPLSKWTPGLSNTFLLNWGFYEHARRRNAPERPMIYHRWGGLGSHRYQVGFSGDVGISWESLKFLPWFTATASNVGYGYWGHDIGGHALYGGKREMGSDPELFTRWLQYGVFTPIFKTHCTRDRAIERYPWRYTDHQFYIRDAFNLRYRLAPYLYTAARTAFDTGVSPCRPMYYAWPEEERAYDPELRQHMFGPDVLAACIAEPTDPETGLAPVTVWLPPVEGGWYEVASGSLLKGGRDVTRRYTIAEAPWFVRAGAVIPLYPDSVRNLARATDAEIVFAIAPGAKSGEGELYEDDGVSADFARQGAFTTCRWRETSEADGAWALEATVELRRGAFRGASETRTVEFRFLSRLPPRAVTCDGSALPYARFGGEGTWTYDGRRQTVTVRTTPVAAAKGTSVRLSYAAGDRALEAKVDGLKGQLGRLDDLTNACKFEYNRVKPRSLMPPVYAYVRTGSRLTEFPSRAAEELAACEEARVRLEKTLPTLTDERVSTNLVNRLRAGLYAGGED